MCGLWNLELPLLIDQVSCSRMEATGIFTDKLKMTCEICNLDLVEFKFDCSKSPKILAYDNNKMMWQVKLSSEQGRKRKGPSNRDPIAHILCSSRHLFHPYASAISSNFEYSLATFYQKGWHQAIPAA